MSTTEIVDRTCQNCGEIIPKYATHFRQQGDDWRDGYYVCESRPASSPPAPPTMTGTLAGNRAEKLRDNLHKLTTESPWFQTDAPKAPSTEPRYNDVCRCGHRAKNHFAYTERCTLMKCDCQEFIPERAGPTSEQITEAVIAAEDRLNATLPELRTLFGI